MSSVGTTPAQSRLFVEEMKRRARRQVLGALALLFLSLTVLPVLFEKRSTHRQTPPQMRWETTPSAEELDPATENVTQMERAQPPNLAPDEISESIPSRPQNNTKAMLKGNEEGTSLSLLPSGSDKKTFSSYTSSPTAPRSKPTTARVSSEDALLEQQAYEKKLAEKKAKKEKARKLALEKAANAQPASTGINELRSDELDDIREARTPIKRPNSKEERETPYKNVDNDQALPIRPLKATKSRISEFPDPESENRPMPRATKKRLDDEDTIDAAPPRRVRRNEEDLSDAQPAAYAIQMGALASEEKAANLRSRINQAGLSAYVQRVTIKSGETVYRVRLGPFKQRESAEKTLRTLRSQGYNAVLTPLQRTTNASR